ncbi:MAG: ABC transporter permease [Bdellovibrio sp.]|nr:ABC transporter permease [Bdellovibrio sp.]
MKQKSKFSKILKNRNLKIGMSLFGFFLFLVALSYVAAPYSYQDVFPDFQLAAPFWKAAGTSQFWLGTDDLGRDLLSRLLVGARFSVGIGVVSTVFSILIAASLGIISAYYKGRTDKILNQIMESLQAVPSLLLALIVIVVLGSGLINTILSVTIVALPSMYRLVRSAAMVEVSKEYIQASEALGASDIRIMIQHLLPNCLTPILVQSAVCFSDAVLNTAALGFLGLGVQPPYPEWGTMLSDAKNFIEVAPWLMTIPGFCLLLLILSTQLISDGLRDQLDPKLRNRT